MIEVEIRSKIDNVEKLKLNLEKLGAVFVKTIRQIDKIFGKDDFLDDQGKLVEGAICPRIRVIDNNIRLEFKEISRQGGGVEINAILDDIDSGIFLLKK